MSNYKESYGVHAHNCGYDFSLSRNPYGCSENVYKILRERVSSVNFYPVSEHAFIEAISKKENIHTNSIIITAGSIQGIDLIADVCLNAGDELIVPEITFEEFVYSASRKKPSFVRSKMTDDLGIDIDDIITRITDKTKLVYIVNPNNPTGNSLKASEIVRVARALKGGYLVVDEANIEFDVGCESALRYVGEFRNIIVTRTFSKAYGISGLRVAYICAPLEIAEKLKDGYPPYKCSELAILAAMTALRDEEFLNESIKKIRLEYRRFSHFLDRFGVGYLPSDVHTVLIKRPEKFKTLNAFVDFLDKRDISVVRCDNCDAVRIVLLTANENNYFMDVLQKGLNA